jgi:RNA polymerase sigma-70 factor (ECF subfamily)
LETASHAPLHAPSPLASGYEPPSTSVPASSPSAEVTPAPCLDEARVNQFVEATERYRPQLIWLANRIVNRAEEAEDIVQQALLKAFRKLSGFRGESQMRTWLNAIVKNTAREYMRGQRGRTFISLESPAHADEGSDEMEIVDHDLNPEEYCEHREREQILAAAIGGMGPANREVVEMCVFQELPYMEVATTLNVSLSTVKSRMFRSRRDLRMALSSRTGAFR